MKLIILDHIRRWWLILAVIFVAYFAIQAFCIRENNSQMSDDPTVASVQYTINHIHSGFAFQAIMWLGFLLVWDFQRGLPRVLTSLPVTAKQIGRAWWVAAVALPAISLGVIGSLAVLIFPGGNNHMVSLNGFLMDWILIVLYLGAAFGALTLMATTIPDNFTDRIRAVLSTSFFALTVFGFMFIQLITTLTLTQKMLIFSSFVILSVLGWFRAEQMVLQRASSRLVVKSSHKKAAQHKIPQGSGGLSYLVQRTFVQTMLISLAIISWMILSISFFPRSHSQNCVQAIGSMIDGGSIAYVFVLLVFISPVVFQLRFLRTLPISPSALAATLVLLPVISVAAVGVIVMALASFMAGEAVIPPAANGFLMLGAKAAIMVSLIVWRGLDATTYIFMFLMMVSDSFISLGLTIIFHLGSKSPERPWWVSLTIFLLCVAASFAMTRRLLAKSSSAYRVRTMPVNAWGMARR